MRIYTSYYSKLVSSPGTFLLVNIAVGHARYFPHAVLDLPEVYPNWDTMVKPYKDGQLTAKQYTDLYREQLNTLDRNKILVKLREFSYRHSDRDIILLCHCGTNKFCHRHLFAEWLDCSVKELVAIWNPDGQLEREVSFVCETGDEMYEY